MQSGQRMQSIANLIELSEAARERRLAELLREQAQHQKHLDMLRHYRTETAGKQGREAAEGALVAHLLRTSQNYLKALDSAIQQGLQRAELFARDVERLQQECLQVRRRVRGIEDLAERYLAHDQKAQALRSDLALDDYPRRPDHMGS